MALTLPPTEMNFKDVAELLRQGGIAALPTETVYGLAGRIGSPEAISAIFKTKERPFFDPLIVHIANKDEVDRVSAGFSEPNQVLAEAFWPGPLTLVLPRRPSLNPQITSGLDQVAVRCPDHPIFLKVLAYLGEPLAAPSANRFGRISPTLPAHVEKEFPQAHFPILDGGPCRVGLESTVAEVTEVSSAQLVLKTYRPGGIADAEILRVLSHHGWSVQLIPNESSPASPGHLKHHYMPRTPLIIIDTKKRFSDPHIQNLLNRKLGPISQWRELVLEKDPPLAARSLYSKLRELDEQNPGAIYVVRKKMHAHPAWKPHWNRLTRAAHLDLSSFPKAEA